MIRDPQQAFFTRLRVEIEKKYRGRVYDGHLPPDGTPYPFIYLADSMSVDVPTKSGYIARITQTIRVYSNQADQRGDLSAMLYEIKAIARGIEPFHEVDITQQILPDNTTAEPLLCGIIQITVKG